MFGPADLAAGAMIAAAVLWLLKSKAVRVAAAAFFAAIAGQVLGTWLSTFEPAEMLSAGGAAGSWIGSHLAVAFGAAAVGVGAGIRFFFRRK